MPIVTLRDLYVAELYDLYEVERQVLQELPALAARATSADLKRLFDSHVEETAVHLERLELLLRQLNDRPPQEGGEAMRGLIQETRRRVDATERGEVLDAALIAAAQRIEHHEIAAYGCVRTYARTLGDGEAARLLQQTLDEEIAADQALSRVAQQGINQAAGADLVEASTTYRSRLRYVAAADLDDFPHRDSAISNDDDDELGQLDGFIVDEDSSRPVYAIVDSGGWFAGRHYVLPVGHLRPDGAGRLRTGLTREQLRRHPEFSPSAFVAMEDDEVRQYARRLAGVGRSPAATAETPAQEPEYQGPMYEASDWLLSGIWIAPPERRPGSGQQRASAQPQPSNRTASQPGRAGGTVAAETVDREEERMVAWADTATEHKRDRGSQSEAPTAPTGERSAEGADAMDRPANSRPSDSTERIEKYSER